MTNLALWDSLCETDPKYTKEFKRPGGFKGTAQNPTYVIRKLTDKLGPVGKGWGFDEPKFTFKDSPDGECLVFCTLKAWHGSPDQIVYGVGGDVCIKKTDYGLRIDDEAQKKAFTDAFTNAFKFIGVGADLHLGMFDDSKYVNDLKAKLGEEKAVDKVELKKPDPESAYKAAKSFQTQHVNDMKLSGSIDALEVLINNNADKRARIKENYPDLWEAIEHEENSIRDGGFDAEPKLKFASVADAEKWAKERSDYLDTNLEWPDLENFEYANMPYLLSKDGKPSVLDACLSAKKYIKEEKTPSQRIIEKLKFKITALQSNQG